MRRDVLFHTLTSRDVKDHLTFRPGSHSVSQSICFCLEMISVEFWAELHRPHHVLDLKPTHMFPVVSEGPNFYQMIQSNRLRKLCMANPLKCRFYALAAICCPQEPQVDWQMRHLSKSFYVIWFFYVIWWLAYAQTEGWIFQIIAITLDSPKLNKI